MKDTFIITQDLSWTDYFRLLVFMFLQNKYIRRLFIFITCIGLLNGVLTILAHGENEIVTAFSIIKPVLLAPFVLLVFFIVLMLLGSLFISKFKPNIIRGINYRFTHWGMDVNGTKLTANIPWKDFLKIKETKYFILVYVKTNKVDNLYGIKKSSLDNANDVVEFKQFLEKNITL